LFVITDYGIFGPAPVQARLFLESEMFADLSQLHAFSQLRQFDMLDHYVGDFEFSKVDYF
jgi:hypothetical protein